MLWRRRRANRGRPIRRARGCRTRARGRRTSPARRRASRRSARPQAAVGPARDVDVPQRVGRDAIAVVAVAGPELFGPLEDQRRGVQGSGRRKNFIEAALPAETGYTRSNFSKLSGLRQSQADLRFSSKKSKDVPKSSPRLGLAGSSYLRRSARLECRLGPPPVIDGLPPIATRPRRVRGDQKCGP